MLESILNIDHLSEAEIIDYYSLSDSDIELINSHKRNHNRLGFAVQLCLLRYPGYSLNKLKNVSNNIIKYISSQINIDPKLFSVYAQRSNTSQEHLEEIRQIFGYKNFDDTYNKKFLNILKQRAMENDSTLFLMKNAIDLFRKDKIILPAASAMEKLINTAKNRSEVSIFSILTDKLSSKQKYRLEKIINPEEKSEKTLLFWLREIPGHSSPESFIKVIQKLKYIRGIGLNIDTILIHPNRFLQLARLGSRYEPYSFRRFGEKKRYALLVAHLLLLSQELTDYAIEIHDRQMLILQSKGRKKQEEIQKQNGKSINEKVIHYTEIGMALLNAKKSGKNPYSEIERIMSWEQIADSINEAKELLRPRNYDYLDLIKYRYNYLRKYTPILLESLQFKSTQSSTNLLKALDIIQNLNISGKRKIPDDAPIDFISKRWLKYVIDDDGNINRQYYEMAALTELKNDIRSGNIWIEGSRMHKKFGEYIISENKWQEIKKEGVNPSVNLKFSEYIKEREKTLNDKLERISQSINQIGCIDLKKNKIHIERLKADVPEEAKEFSRYLYKRLPRIKLTELLMEVAQWTEFHNSFIHSASNHIPKEEEIPIIMATIMGVGTNIGLTKMADATPGMSYRQMANIMQWRLYEKSLIHAQAKLVNYQKKLPLSSYWGDGTTSSSDGMRVPVKGSSLYADSNPHYGTGKGSTIYRFTSDQFSSYYTTVINTNARDATYVIDGLLNHETDLNIQEHYTDTSGYTDQIFGLTHLLGFKFYPRLRDIGEAKLFFISSFKNYPELKNIFKGKINIGLIQENFEDILRLVHSIREGKVSGSLIMGKLSSYTRQNKISTSLRELGRIEKTIFILDYIVDESLRRRINRGLNKGEAMNALARALFFGKRGEFRENRFQDQLQRASALNIIINAISVWNTVYLNEVIKRLREKTELNEELISHISPLGWEHINFFGEYKFAKPDYAGNLRELNETSV